MSPTCYMLVGVPGSGKSTWIAKQPFDWNRTVIASTDSFIELQAKKEGSTYNDVFADNMSPAIKHMAAVVIDAVKNKYDIIWDQTSTTIRSRAKKFRMLTPDYRVVGVVFQTPEQKELERRLSSRPGKNIPKQVMTSMIDGWEEPSETEGFDQIVYVR
jgi:predicted kinase